MIIEKLMRQADFTDVEKSIADYLLQNGYEVKNMSISDLAKRTYSSPATITRFCRKLDLDGYAVGGLAVGESHEEMYRILDEVVPHLPRQRPNCSFIRPSFRQISSGTSV